MRLIMYYDDKLQSADTLETWIDLLYYIMVNH